MANKKVRLLTGIASAEWSYAPGEVVEIDADLASAWLESGIAERVEVVEKAERGNAKAEKAVTPRGKKG